MAHHCAVLVCADHRQIRRQSDHLPGDSMTRSCVQTARPSATTTNCSGRRGGLQTVRKAGRNTVTIASNASHAGETRLLCSTNRRRLRQRHQCRLLSFPNISDSPRNSRCRVSTKEQRNDPQATGLPGQIGKDRHDLPQTAARIPDVLLDLSFLPACSRITELRLKDVVVGHRLETSIDVSLFTVLRDPQPSSYCRRCPDQAHPRIREGVPMRVEQHLVRLERIGPHQKLRGVRQPACHPA